MREIKFRAWDKTFKKMHKVDAIDWFEGWCYCDNEKMDEGRLELMQYTGLKDANGKEIYEGDIISWFDGEKRNVEIIWKYGSWQISDNDEDTMSLFHYEEYVHEVIGNIYENPELIK
mgnify:CR=1 FL=1